MKLSVVIPVKNSEETIDSSIRSVLSQECDLDIEVICVINDTVDNTEKVIKSVNDNRIRILHSAPGIVSALNTGLRASTGDLIARQDADDIWLPSKLKNQIEFLKKNQDIDILGTQLKVVDKTGRHINDTKYPTRHSSIVDSLLQGINPIGHPSVIFKKKVLDKCSGYFDLFPLAEDLDLWTRAIPWYRFANLEETHVVYRHIPNPKYNPNVPKTLASWYRIIYGIS